MPYEESSVYSGINFQHPELMSEDDQERLQHRELAHRQHQYLASLARLLYYNQVGRMLYFGVTLVARDRVGVGYVQMLINTV